MFFWLGMGTIPTTAGNAAWVSAALNEPPPVFPEGYDDPETFGKTLRELAAARSDCLQLTQVGTSLERRPIWLVTITRDVAALERPDPNLRANDARRPTKPGVLIAAGLEGDHLVGCQVALKLIERLSGDDEAALQIRERVVVYVLPQLNPDAAERLFGTPRRVVRANLRPLDRDRDGQFAEDGPEDLDGDGLILTMRRPLPAGTAVGRGRIPLEEDARGSRPADPAKAERGVFLELVEGIDNDGDGRLYEDPEDGVHLARNFPQDWSEFDPEAGWAPGSEPESLVMLRFVADHPELVAVWLFGLRDTLRDEPPTGAAGPLDGDRPLYADLTQLYRRLAGLDPKPKPSKDDQNQKENQSTPHDPTTSPADHSDQPVKRNAVAVVLAPPHPVEPNDKPSDPAVQPARLEEPRRDLAQPVQDENQPQDAANPTLNQPKAEPTLSRPAPVVGQGPIPPPPTDGHPLEWLEKQRGLVAFGSRLWSGPEPPGVDADDLKTNPTLNALRWNDQVMNGRAFKPFTPFEHPTLGSVEIGGWLPGVLLNPPADQIEAIAEVHWAMLCEVTRKPPRLAVTQLEVTHRGGPIHTVEATIANLGQWPTATARGLANRTAHPVLVRLELPQDIRVLVGRANESLERLEGSGGSKVLRWTLLVPPPVAVDQARLVVFHPQAGVVVRPLQRKHK